MFKIEDIYEAYRDCIKRKKSSKDYLSYILNFGEQDLYDLLQEINSKNYIIRPSTCFIATKPKLREIFAADFRDRIVHHLVVKAIEPYFEKRFSDGVYSCRVGKGNIAGVKKLFGIVKGLSNNENFFYLQMDIKSFFMSINKKILFEILHKNIPKANIENEELIMYLLEKIIFNDPVIKVRKVGKKHLFDELPSNKTLFKLPKYKGLPIGNLTSQFFANVYLNEFDQYVKRILKVKYYFRYVDDFIIIGKKEDLSLFKEKIEIFLNDNLKLELAHKKTKFLPLNYDINFIGYIIKDKSYIVPRKRNINALKQVIFKKDLSKEEKAQKTFSSINSYFGLIKHSNSFFLRKKFSSKIQDNCVFSDFKDYSKITFDKQIYNILDSKDKKTMQKYKQIKQTFKKHIIFIQIGCLYKSFDNEAIFIAPKLDLKLTLFNPKTKAESIMCGFHEKYLDKYLDKLDKLKINYVILKQKKDEKGFIEREIFKINLFDENFLIPISTIDQVNKIKAKYFESKIKKEFLSNSKNDNSTYSFSNKEKEFLETFRNNDFLKMNSYEVLSFVYDWKNILTDKSD